MSAHAWAASGRCSACAMHREWPGARAECTLRAPHEKSAQRAAQKRRATARRREKQAAYSAARRERLGPEAVRAENLRHQHAKRERDRAEAAE